LLVVHSIPMYRVRRLYDTHPFSVPKSAGNMTVQDPNVGISPSKSVNSPTWHHVYGKVLPSTYVCSEQQGLLCIWVGPLAILHSLLQL